jgi:hypothetical protein
MTAWKHHVNNQHVKDKSKAAQNEQGSARSTSVAPSPSLAASSFESGWFSWVWHSWLKNSTVELLMTPGVINSECGWMGRGAGRNRQRQVLLKAALPNG